MDELNNKYDQKIIDSIIDRLARESLDEDSYLDEGVVDLDRLDPLFEEAAQLIVIHQEGSTSLIQRKFSIGYNRAGHIVDQLEAAGIIGPSEGSKARRVLVMDEYHLEQILSRLDSHIAYFNKEVEEVKLKYADEIKKKRNAR